jgi:hypothetical protein
MIFDAAIPGADNAPLLARRRVLNQNIGPVAKVSGEKGIIDSFGQNALQGRETHEPGEMVAIHLMVDEFAQLQPFRRQGRAARRNGFVAG